jgi:demethoxyubiquinone hydroxylase (CLK1/Coq7/Cat5 family)
MLATCYATTHEADMPAAHTTALPGDPSPDATLDAMIRVNHAGEYGAKRIYQGQLAILGRQPVGDTLRHMAEQEQVHLSHFEDLLNQHRAHGAARRKSRHGLHRRRRVRHQRPLRAASLAAGRIRGGA